LIAIPVLNQLTTIGTNISKICELFKLAPTDTTGSTDIGRGGGVAVNRGKNPGISDVAKAVIAVLNVTGAVGNTNPLIVPIYADLANGNTEVFIGGVIDAARNNKALLNLSLESIKSTG
jgi:hypothetical protein